MQGLGVQGEFSVQWGFSFSFQCAVCAAEIALRTVNFAMRRWWWPLTPAFCHTWLAPRGTSHIILNVAHTAPCPHSCTLGIAHLRDCTLDSAHLVGSQVYIQVTLLPSPMPPVTANQRYQLTLIHPASSTGHHHNTGKSTSCCRQIFHWCLFSFF